MKNKKIAVFLAGCGHRDGSEIRESVATLYALSKFNVQVQSFSLNKLQYDVINHLTQEAQSGEKRNLLQEAARIARGTIEDVHALFEEFKDYHGIIFPGGYGVAKNLCNFALQGSQASVDPQIERLIQMFWEAKKPIGAICISPALVALALREIKLELTLGVKSEASAEIEKLGHRHFECNAYQIHIDEKNKIVTTPAYMLDQAPLHEIFQGIESLVQAVVQRA